MSKLKELIARGELSVEELVAVSEEDAATKSKLVERAKLVIKGLEACKQTLHIPNGEIDVECYYYENAKFNYKAWGIYYDDGFLYLYSNLVGSTKIVDLNDAADVFMALDDFLFGIGNDLERFLSQQIEKASQK